MSKQPTGGRKGREFTAVSKGDRVILADYLQKHDPETLAVLKAVSEGGYVDAVAIASSTGNSSPCGACRQILYEINKNMIIYFLKDGELISKNISQLLPDAFELEDLK